MAQSPASQLPQGSYDFQALCSPVEQVSSNFGVLCSPCGAGVEYFSGVVQYRGSWLAGDWASQANAKLQAMTLCFAPPPPTQPLLQLQRAVQLLTAKQAHEGVLAQVFGTLAAGHAALQPGEQPAAVVAVQRTDQIGVWALCRRQAASPRNECIN